MWRAATAVVCVVASVAVVSPTVALAQRPRPDTAVARAHNATPKPNPRMTFRRTPPVRGHLRRTSTTPTTDPTVVMHNMAALETPLDEDWTVGSHWLRNGDGTFTGEFYGGPEFRQVAGTWLPIDPTLALGLGGLVTSPASLVPLTFGLDTNHLTTFALPDGTVTESLVGAPLPAVPLPVGQTITYAGIAPDTDLQMTVTNGGVKEALVLHSAVAPTTFNFHLADPSGALGAVSETAPETYQFANPVAPETYLELPHPFAYEQQTASDTQAPDLDSAHQSVVAAGDGFDVTLSVDPSWLDGKSYPIVLDPPVTFINGNFHILEFLKYSSGHSGCGAAGDGCIGYVPSATEPNALGAGTQTEKVGTTYLADGRPARVDYYFAISQIPSGSSVTQADLNLYGNGCIGYSEYNCNANSYREQFYPLTATVDTTTTYHDFNLATGTVLNSSSLIAPFAPGTRRQFSWGVVNVVKYWIGTDPNNRAHLDYGFGQKLDNEPSTGNIGGPSFAGPNDTTDPHPSLVVDWSPPPGQMAAPTLASTSPTSLRATFSAPSNSGPAIDLYKVDLYRSSDSSLVTSGTCTAPCTTVNFTGLAYDSYYVVAEAHNSVNYGPTSAHSNTVVLSPAPQLTKTLLTASTNGYYARGQLLRYKLHIVNPGPNVMSVTSVTDSVPGQIVATGAVTTLNGGSCSACSVAGNTITASNLTVPGTSSGQNWIDLIYSVVASGIERGCTTVTNTATATNSFGSSSGSVPVTICDTGLGVEPWWSYVSTTVGAQSTAQVNVMNGNLVVQATDSTPVPARGHFDYVIRRTYNSQDAAVLTLPGSLGGGWLLNVGQADDLAGDGVTTTGLSVPQPVNETPASLLAPIAVTMIDRDGTRHVFTYRSASVGIGSGVDVNTLTQAARLMVPVNPKLLPSTLSGTSGFGTVCVDATYQPPPGVHVALWRYVGVSNGCANELTDGSARVLGFSAVRPDRLRYDYDLTGHLLDMVDGSGVDLRYAYDGQGRLTTVYEARTCSTPGVNGCRGITVTYPSSTETDVTDPAGRVTKYFFDGAVPVTHLMQVVNPPQTGGAGTGTTTSDNVQYAYQGVAGASCTGATTGQLCRITDARGKTTNFSYASQTLGLPRVTGFTDRRGTATTITYHDTATPYVDADNGTHRTEYSSIDTSGRVGEVDQGDTSSNWLRRTSDVWDTTSAPCTYVHGSLKGSPTTWKRQENNLCQIVRSVTSTATETTKYTYAPEGTMLSSQQLMNGQGADRYVTYSYAVQYVRSGGQSSITGTDTLWGGGDVTLASRDTAIGDGGSVAGNSSVLYAISDLVGVASPNGNVTGANVSNFTTTYTRANSSTATPDTATSSSCTSQNSGLICTVSTPRQGSSRSSTTYGYDPYGQKVSATVPRSAAGESPPSGQGTQYFYTYYGPTGRDLSNSVSTEGWLEAVTDPASHFVAYAYDQAGNRVRTWDRNATAGSFDPATFVASGNTRYAQALYAASTSTKPWRYELSARDPIGNTVNYTRDADGDALTTTSARGKTTTQVFDEADNVVSVTTPLESGNPAAFAYDQWGNLTSSKAPNGAYAVRTYDSVNRLTGVYTDRGATATTTNPGGNCADSTTTPRLPIPSGEIVCATLTNYDYADNVTSTQAGDGALTTYTYDPANRRTAATVPRTGSVSYTTTTVYDADGNVTDVCPPRQTVEGGTSGCPATGLYSTHNTYTEADRLTSTTTYRAVPPTTHGTRAVTPATQTMTTTYAYDADGNLVSTTDPNSHVISATYDFLDRRITETRSRVSGQPATTVYTYDPAGNVTAVTRPGSQPLGDTSSTDLNVTSGTYTLPSTNVSYRSITLTGGATLVAPATGGALTLTINVAGTVNVCAGCSIVVDGRGDAGGQPNAGLNQPGGNGAGSGGGTGGGFGASSGGGGGGGSYSMLGTAGTTVTGGGAAGGAGSTYGSDTSPESGSGGGAGGSTPLAAGGAGGAGGGFVHISADNIVLNGVVSSQGTAGSAGATSTGQTGGGGGGGSGGGIWLTAPTISGTGGINVNGAAGYTGTANGGGSGGAGRVRVDADSQTATGLLGYPTHRLGLLTAYSYDADNRLVDTVLGADNPSAASAGLVDSAGGINVRTRIAYDADGNVAARFEPRAFTASTTTPDPRYEQVTTYDDDGRVAATYLPYADAGNDPLNGPATSSQCDTGTAYVNADPNAGTDHVGDYASSSMRICKTAYGYDHNGNRVSVVLPTSAAAKAAAGSDQRNVTYAYTPDNLLLSTSIPNPTATVASNRITEHQYSYDGAGRVVQDKQVTAQAPATVTSYTLDGLVSTVTPPAGPTGLSHQVSYGYDSNGEQTSVTTNVDASTTRTSYTDYNSDGSVLAQVDAAGNTTSNSYDLAGNPTAVYSPNANAGDSANPNHLATTYSYFDDNLLRTSFAPTLSDGSRYRLTTYGYDAGGRKLSVDVDYTTSGGSVTTNGTPQTFSYLSDDRMAGSGGRGGGTQTYSYDPAGNMTSGSDNSGGSTVTTTASYYLNGLPRSVSENSTTTTYSYDATGAVAGLQSVTGAGTLTSTYGYTDAEQPATVTGGTLGAGVTLSVGYDDQQRPVSASYTNGPAQSRTWNADSTLAAQTLTAQGGGSVATWNYGYDGMGRVLYAANDTASTDCVPSQPATGLQCFTYDVAGRLGSFHDASAARSMTYDHDGNRTGYGPALTDPCVPAAGLVCAKYNPDDSIKQQSSNATWNTFSYGLPFGGVTNDGCSTYAYDGFDRLSSTSGIAGTACAGKGTTEASDILDRQARRTDTSSSVTTTLGYAGLGTQPTSEATSSGTTRYTVSADGGMPLAVSTASAAQYLFDDGRGNIATTTSTSGARQCALRYDPWGSFVGAVTSDGCTNAGGTTPSDMFYGAGRRDATTGTYQLGSRTYDPGKAGFLNPDGYRTAPSAADLSVGTDPLTRDTYNYVNGDPINLIDPSGHMNASEGGGGCGKMSNADCRRLEDWVAEAVTVEYLNQANTAGIRAQAELDKAAYERKHRCDGWGHFSCAASAVADAATTGVKVGVNFVGGAAAGIVDEATSVVTLGMYDPGFDGCAFGGGGVVGGACTAGRVTGRVGVELAALAGSGGAAGALDAVRAARAVEVVSNIASKARVVAKLRTVETGVADATRFERAASTGTEIFRGVAKDHQAYDDALRGIARPGDPLGHADAALHNRGFTYNSRLTSWSTDPQVAQQFAGKDGVILRTTVGEMEARGVNVVRSPDVFEEGEVLLEGAVDGLRFF